MWMRVEAPTFNCSFDEQRKLCSAGFLDIAILLFFVVKPIHKKEFFIVLYQRSMDKEGNMKRT
jgi:hypothetical protein